MSFAHNIRDWVVYDREVVLVQDTRVYTFVAAGYPRSCNQCRVNGMWVHEGRVRSLRTRIALDNDLDNLLETFVQEVDTNNTQ